MILVGKALKKKKFYFSTVIKVYLNHPFLIGVFSSSFLIEAILTAFLKAKLASTTVIVDIRNKPDIPINCSVWLGSLSPCKIIPITNHAVTAPVVMKYGNHLLWYR